ncbi:hypothetical protein [Gaetbulibacter saemankumensis]|uniref:hypothetical protein n=1 Tax=Gaetbulibacter saemankumensis TaxID=311208 RepID=UPI00041E3ADE|nr:hypothetical protein [Gaetbulibacter saemankumensis]
MDFNFYTQQGHKLLEKKDASSIKKALEYFKKANQITESKDLYKPRALYNLALGNYLAGNTVMAYKLASRASRSLEPAIRNSTIRMDNMSKMLGEDDINYLINYIETNFSELILFTDANDDNFDENELDLSNVNSIYPTSVKSNDYSPKFTLEKITDEMLYATFAGLSRNSDEMVYFDRVKGDVVTYVQGYFSSLLGDQTISNKKLASRISNSDPTDFVDEDRYLLIDQLFLKDFLVEYKEQTEDEEPFLSFPVLYSEEILKEFSYNEDITIHDLYFNNHMQQKFHEIFSKHYASRANELKETYSILFENTCNEIALQWIQKNVF